ncbi:PEP-CTERM protein-sorting domain-containing protein [Cribrihabitans marinus]|uniref:PEP-CTERM protein-sorting domain-containing protein n=1 Tax=Cribrihabitans marinus TaxID=1227549 RepID=A0A1H6QTT8_9RHOB|nr:apolipoprotein acyltransferase [Cribrihabitans marinus]GGH19826.1 hypothetical protein GCM10010973_03380 [Cribrihabitans marinus]SEI46983.1 PEP-CTERM protein-sorting domain-containing protein [Cribrihabitans marinus]
MIYLSMGLLGAILGGMTAKRRKGSRADIAQYAAVYGIAFAMLGLIVTVLLDRTLI